MVLTGSQEAIRSEGQDGKRRGGMKVSYESPTIEQLAAGSLGVVMSGVVPAVVNTNIFTLVIGVVAVNYQAV